MKTTTEDLICELNDAIDEIMLRCQEANGIKCGDVDPWVGIQIDNCVEQLAGLLMGTLAFEKELTEEDERKKSK